MALSLLARALRFLLASLLSPSEDKDAHNRATLRPLAGLLLVRRVRVQLSAGESFSAESVELLVAWLRVRVRVTAPRLVLSCHGALLAPAEPAPPSADANAHGVSLLGRLLGFLLGLAVGELHVSGLEVTLEMGSTSLRLDVDEASAELRRGGLEVAGSLVLSGAHEELLRVEGLQCRLASPAAPSCRARVLLVRMQALERCGAFPQLLALARRIRPHTGRVSTPPTRLPFPMFRASLERVELDEELEEEGQGLGLAGVELRCDGSDASLTVAGVLGPGPHSPWCEVGLRGEGELSVRVAAGAELALDVRTLRAALSLASSCGRLLSVLGPPLPPLPSSSSALRLHCDGLALVLRHARRPLCRLSLAALLSAPGEASLGAIELCMRDGEAWRSAALLRDLALTPPERNPDSVCARLLPGASLLQWRALLHVAPERRSRVALGLLALDAWPEGLVALGLLLGALVESARPAPLLSRLRLPLQLALAGWTLELASLSARASAGQLLLSLSTPLRADLSTLGGVAWTASLSAPAVSVQAQGGAGAYEACLLTPSGPLLSCAAFPSALFLSERSGALEGLWRQSVWSEAALERCDMCLRSGDANQLLVLASRFFDDRVPSLFPRRAPPAAPPLVAVCPPHVARLSVRHLCAQLHRAGKVGSFAAQDLVVGAVALGALVQVQGCLRPRYEDGAPATRFGTLLEDLDDSGPAGVDFHLSVPATGSPLLECRLRGLRVVYLQRAMMAFVSLLQEVCGAAWEAGAARDSDQLAWLACRPRIAVSGTSLELLLPVNSHSNDAIVAVLGRVLFHERCGEVSAADSAFHRGPWIARGEWLSLADQVRDGFAGAEELDWRIAALGSALRAPAGLVRLAESHFDIAVTDATLCSMCNSNEICSGLSVRAELSVSPVQGVCEGAYPAVLESLGLRAAPPLTHVQVCVQVDCLEAALAQGQYMALVLLVQQNFEEQEEPPAEPYHLQRAPRVLLREDAFGRSLLDEGCFAPLLSFVSVRVGEGSIEVLENDADYCERYSSAQSLFRESCHHAHRAALLRRKLGGEGLVLDCPVEPVEPLLRVEFADLYIEFTHRHYLAGNGVEVSARRLVLLAPPSEEADAAPAAQAARVLFGPRSLSALSRALREGGGLTSDRPHVVYTQQGCTNFRRCHIDISDSFASAQAHLVARAVNLFLNPVSFLNERYGLALSRDKVRPDAYEFKGAMDVELRLRNTTLASPWRGALESEVLCLTLDAHYAHCWRGFVDTGPGKVSQQGSATVRQVYIADIADALPLSVEGMVKPFGLSASLVREVHAAGPDSAARLLMLRSCMCVPHWRAAAPDAPGFGTSTVNLAMETASGSIDCRLSLKDLAFVAGALADLNKDVRSIPLFPTLKSQLSGMLTDFRDLAHLVPVTHYAMHLVSEAPAPPVKKQEMSGRMDPVTLTLVNNMYNLKIARLSVACADLCLVVARKARSVSGGAKISLWAYNDKLLVWEPIVEPFDVAVMSANIVSMEDAEVWKERVGVSAGSVDLVVNQFTLIGAIKKLSLADVHTSSSNKLPPYTVVNALGAAARCSVVLGDSLVILDSVLGDATRTDLESRYFGLSSPCFMSLEFVCEERTFKSRRPIEIQSEGSFAFALDLLDARLDDKSEDFPIVFLTHVINGDGSRDLVLRSALFLKNITDKRCNLSVKRDFLAESRRLAPGEGWHLPVHLAHRASSLFVRVDDDSGWVSALFSLDSMVTKGKWGAPSQLRSQLCECPSLGARWGSCTVLLKPFAASLSHASGFVPVRQPSVESIREFSSLPSQAASRVESFFDFRSSNLSPVSVLIMAPLTLHNQICQPFLYRFANAEGLLFAEGALSRGECVDLHNMPRLFEDKFYVSVRLLNYNWSPWTCLLSSRPFNASEKTVEVSLSSLLLTEDDVSFSLPPLHLHLASLENNVRVNCPFWLSNRSGQTLEFSSSAATSEVLLLRSHSSIDELIKSDKHSLAHQSRSDLSSFNASRYSLDMQTPPVVSDLTQGSNEEASLPCTALRVHSHANHFESVDLLVPPAATAREVIQLMLAACPPKSAAPVASDYVLLYWPKGGGAASRKVEPSPLAEEKMFSAIRNALKQTSDPAQRSLDFDIDGDSTTEDDGIPPKSRFNMAAECSATFLPFDTAAAQLTCASVRVCHILEFCVFRQANSLSRINSAAKPGIRPKMFQQAKTAFVAPFVNFRGSVPYNPVRLLSLTRSVVFARVHTSQKWSRQIVLTSLGLENVTVASTGLTFNDKEEVFEFGLFAVKGQGVLQSSTIVTFVPRTVLHSRLSVPLLMRNIGCEHVQAQELAAGAVRAHHPLHLADRKLVEVCRSPSSEELFWTGELSLSKPGTTFVLLRNTEWLLKVKLELVGGTFVVTFSEHSSQWPPYVFRNDTDFNLRFMQGSASEVARRGGSSWIDLRARGSCPYVWEFPHSLQRSVVLQYESSGGWVDLEGVAPDETDICEFRRIKARSPRLDEAKEGLVMWRPSADGSWVRAHCVLSADTLFLFKSEALAELIGVVNLTREQNGTLQLVSISRIDTRKEFFSSAAFRKYTGLDDIVDFPDSFFDVNAVRMRMLSIGQHLAFFDSFSGAVESPSADALRDLVRAGVSVEALLKHLATRAVTIDQLRDALLELSIVPTSATAIALIDAMQARGLLTAYSPLNPLSALQMLLLEPSSILYMSPPPLALAQSDVDADLLEDGGFAVCLEGESPHAFKCFSAIDYLEWITMCRYAAEAAWVSFVKGERAVDSDLTLDSYFANVVIRGKSDGPSRVLEISESGDAGGLSDPYSRYAQHEVSRLDAVAGSSGFLVVVAIEAVSLSVMDADPTELLLAKLSDWTVTVEQLNGEVARIATAITVQDAQIDNQLLSPAAPLMLHPRSVPGFSGEKLRLHGLQQAGDRFPALHVYFQQKLHFEIGSIAGLLSGGNQYMDLLYFDIATVWLAPLHVDVEEEVLVRSVRLCQKLRDQHVLSKASARLAGAVPSTVDRAALFSAMRDMDAGCARTYGDTGGDVALARGVHFTVLHLHPVDVILTFRPSPKFYTSTLEQSYLAVFAQLNSSRICLNALIVENAFGTPRVILDVVSKHYVIGMLRQISVAIGNSDGYEGSVGLITNIGTGVVDVFYEPIAGLLDEKGGSFLGGLSKGASSLASRTIGGTSAFTSQLTGGIGKGMSLLTLDADFQHGRSMRRLNRSKNISEGIVVGTKDLGKNIVDGVVGVVAEPMKGWETGGAIGFGLGFAKGILGIAFKPAIGVLDLASRATEGIRNTAFSESFYDESNRLPRFRVPRTFGPSGEVLPFASFAASAQFLVDRVTGFDKERRCRVHYHSFLHRQLRDGSESWGMASNECFLLVVAADRMLLCRFVLGAEETRRGRGTGVYPDADVRLVWSCPLASVSEAFTDARGDLVMRVNCAVKLSGGWSDPYPVLHDPVAKDFMALQLLLEKTIGVALARDYLLSPAGELTAFDVLKKQATSLGSMVRSPTKQVLVLAGCVLYEYTVITTVRPEAEEGAVSAVEAVDNFTAKSINVFMRTVSHRAKPKDFAVLTYVYPLVNICSEGLSYEETGRVAIKIAREDGKSLQVLKRADDKALLAEAERKSVVYTFRTLAEAVSWQNELKSRSVPDAQGYPIRRNSESFATLMRKFKRVRRLKGGRMAEEAVEADGQDLEAFANILVVPSASDDLAAVESVKLNIVKYFAS